MNKSCSGDNFESLREVDDERVDFIGTDPLFNNGEAITPSWTARLCEGKYSQAIIFLEGARLMKQGFLYEFNCIEDGEWIPEKQTFEDKMVEDLRIIWKHRYNLEPRYSQQHLRDNAARWRFMRTQREGRRKLVREIRAYRSNREFAPDLHQSLETWYLQNGKKRMDIAYIPKWLLTTSWAEDPSVFRNAKTWESNLQAQL